MLSKLDRIRMDQTQRARTLEEEAHDAERKVAANLLYMVLCAIVLICCCP